MATLPTEAASVLAASAVVVWSALEAGASAVFPPEQPVSAAVKRVAPIIHAVNLFFIMFPLSHMVFVQP